MDKMYNFDAFIFSHMFCFVSEISILKKIYIVVPFEIKFKAVPRRNEKNELKYN